ncbi:MAG: HupE/UreJ family protein [Gammaproteobacteria bacterium]
MSNKYLAGGLATLAALFTAPCAEAHLISEGASWSAGFIHPFVGVDHLLAMLAVGLWAAQQGGGRLWQLPAAFLSMMMLGAYAGQGAMALPSVETGIAGSLLVLGLMLVFAVRLPMAPSLSVVGFFALFHGYAHGTEMPQGMAIVGYAGGFVSATALLHGLGIVSGLSVRRGHYRDLLRLSGLAIGVTGGLLWI